MKVSLTNNRPRPIPLYNKTNWEKMREGMTALQDTITSMDESSSTKDSVQNWPAGQHLPTHPPQDTKENRLLPVDHYGHQEAHSKESIFHDEETWHGGPKSRSPETEAKSAEETTPSTLGLCL